MLNPANGLTLFRMAGALPLAYYLATAWPDAPGAPYTAAGCFLLLALTDWLDGLAARGLAQVSRFGQLADPVADKLLGVLVLAAMAARGGWSVWIVGLLVVKEASLAAGSLWWFKRRTMPAEWPGKIATVVLFVAIVLGLLQVPGAEDLAWAAVALTLFAGVYYARRLSR